MKQELIDQIRETLSDRVISTVAKRTGLSVHAIHRIANGTTTKQGPHEATLRVLADYLGVKL
jgi:transcriptional regulator with XRE-family HTH domain